jgi:hypothetical protein
MQVIDVAIETYYRMAPRFAETIGGRAGIRARFGGMPVGDTETVIGVLGPIPRLDLGEWTAMVDEYYESQRNARFEEHPVGRVEGAEATDRREGFPPTCPSVRGGGFSR